MIAAHLDVIATTKLRILALGDGGPASIIETDAHAEGHVFGTVALADLVADETADHSTAHGGCRAAIALADGIAEHAACHGTALLLEVSDKMVDTRVFTRLYADIAGAFVLRAHADGVDPSLIAARSSLSREYVNFLERYVPALLFAVIGLAVSLTTLFWLDSAVGAACLGLVLPLLLINRWLARRSLALNHGLNDRLADSARSA